MAMDICTNFDQQLARCTIFVHLSIQDSRPCSVRPILHSSAACIASKSNAVLASKFELKSSFRVVESPPQELKTAGIAIPDPVLTVCDVQMTDKKYLGVFKRRRQQLLTWLYIDRMKIAIVNIATCGGLATPI